MCQPFSEPDFPSQYPGAVMLVCFHPSKSFYLLLNVIRPPALNIESKRSMSAITQFNLNLRIPHHRFDPRQIFHLLVCLLPDVTHRASCNTSLFQTTQTHLCSRQSNILLSAASCARSFQPCRKPFLSLQLFCCLLPFDSYQLHYSC